MLVSFVGFWFFSVPGQEIGWEERLQNDLFCVELDVKPCYMPFNQSRSFSVVQAIKSLQYPHLCRDN